jgi:hypothetical protein
MWTLIVMMVAFNNGAATAITTAQYSSRTACVKAKSAVESSQWISSAGTNSVQVQIQAFCTPQDLKDQ